MSRISLSDGFQDVIIKMTDENPGAISALIELSNEVTDIDPDNDFGPFGPALSFDTYEIYGSSIYVIWNDKCFRESRKTLLLLKAVQLGILQKSRLQAMAADQTGSINLTAEEWSDIDVRVCEKLDKFSKD
jgi:hypothetical protein